MRMLSNIYLAVLLAPLAIFVALVRIGVSPDEISLVSRVYVFGLFAYVGARYVGRAPVLMWRGDHSPEARNISGWALLVVGSMCTQVYAWLYIVYDRPDWLAAQFWSPAFVVLIGTGLTLVASSVPRLPPFGSGPGGLSVMASFMVGFGSAGFLFFAGHIGAVVAAIKYALMGMIHAL